MAKEEENQTLYFRAEVNLFIGELGGNSKRDNLKNMLKLDTWSGDKTKNPVRNY